ADAGKLARIAAGLLTGGAPGNAIGRLPYGAVAAFLNMTLPGWQHPYSFKPAGVGIFAGAIGRVRARQQKDPAAPAREPGAKAAGAIGLVLVPQKKDPVAPARKPRAKASDNPRDGTGKSG